MTDIPYAGGGIEEAGGGMIGFDLNRYVRRHNVTAVLKGAGWLTLSAVCWWLSWWLMYGIVGLLCYEFGSLWNWTPSGGLVANAAWVGTGILALEGMRYGTRLLKREVFAKTAYSDVQRSMNASPAIGVYGGANPGAYMYFVTEFLLAAPRTTIRAILAFRSVVSMGDQVIPHAQAVIAQLASVKEWTPPAVFAEHAAALYPLHKLGILWEQVKDGVLTIKLHPNFVDGHLL
jgi:hypothetical protein